MVNHSPGERGGPVCFSSKIANQGAHVEIWYCYKIKWDYYFLVVTLYMSKRFDVFILTPFLFLMIIYCVIILFNHSTNIHWTATICQEWWRDRHNCIPFLFYIDHNFKKLLFTGE